MPITFDLAIVGGGMVGAALAASLAETPLKIALIDAAPVPAPTDHRLIALSFVSCNLLKSLSLWPALAKYAAPIRTIHVSQKGRFGITRLKAADIQRETLGHVIPARHINAALLQSLRSAGNITCLQGTTVTALTQNEHAVTLTLEGLTESLSASLVIAADGTHSTLRRLLNIPVKTAPNLHKALVTVTHLQDPHDGMAYERFHSTGALAMLPLTGQRAATIWTDTSDTIEKLMTEDSESFVGLLQKQMGYRLGRLLRCDERYTYPLQWLEVESAHQKNGRVLLIGNAAHTMHPIAAQGLNLALREVSELSQHFAKQMSKSLTFPDQPDYFKQQKRSLMLSKKLTHIFNASHTGTLVQVPGLLRNFGLVLLDAAGPLRSAALKSLLRSSDLIH